MNDKAIEFEATRIKVIKTINRMKEAKLNVTKYEEIYHKILNNCINDNKTIPESIVNSDTNFATDCLTTNYTKAIKQLDLLFFELSKYEIYVQVSSFTNYLKNFINQNYKVSSDFDIYRESLIDIINKLLKSNTLDYDVEGNIIEEIYEITYYFIKEEIKVLGYSKTLTILENNEINIHYLDKQITRELETLNLKEKKYANILTMKNKIDSSGFNSTYVNEDFLRALTICNLKPKRIAEVVNSLNEQVNNNLKTLNNMDSKTFHLQLDSLEKNKSPKKYKKDILKQIALFITSASILGGLIWGSIVAPREKKYLKTTTTYSQKNGTTTISEYEKGNEDSTIIYELTPYERRELYKDFKRTEITYDVSKFNDIPLDEYLNLDLKELGIEGHKTSNIKNELNLDDTYEETIRYVEKKTVDKDDYQEEYVIYELLLYILLSSVIEFGAQVMFWGSEFNTSNYTALIGSIKSIIDDIKHIKEKKDNNQNVDKEVDELNQKYEKLLLESKDLIKSLISFYGIIKNNSEFYEETYEIEKTLRRIKEKENN